PKIPKHPPKKRCRIPSRSTYCATRNRTNACAAVNLTVPTTALYDAANIVSKLLVRSHEPDTDGCVLRVTPESARWRYVGFEVYRLVAEGALERTSPDQEPCVVVLSGTVDLAAGGQEWHDQGVRQTVFEGPPTGLYVPPGTPWSVGASEPAEIAVCTAPAER